MQSSKKLKLLYLMKLFYEKTDEEHAINMNQILLYLENQGIKAERKSIYDDIEALRNYGLDIVGSKENGTFQYRLVSREFELAELKLLVDAVQCSKFITVDKSQKLIKKIESLVSSYEASQLQRQVYVGNRVKTMNESIYYNVDAIHTAINSNSKIQFKYYEWNVNKKMKLRREGKEYVVSPWTLSWDQENYYLIAYDSEAEIMKHYRVDKITEIQVNNLKRDGREVFEQFDIASYSKKMFGMFAGKEEDVKIQFTNNLVGVVLDRFGQDTILVPEDDEHFTINVRVSASQQFLAWVFGLGTGAKILEPENVVEQMRVEARKLLEQYS
ncbi:helix-turn-helix transcriptional regulator [Clostridium oryzae]|uniref:Uncharacterized protein n=1 Tax=Clostridium oryzae TaxID=1450648 RepID=A0A1V4IRC5_9CLOT|nr:WYL domain-containing protein [Clostridium oryzae]OPJ62572.1 hypothetical protein CLORY_17020 [Clostridium oryzae]